MDYSEEQLLERELTELLNRHSLEGESDTPDFLLASYMLKSLSVFHEIVYEREHWYGRKLKSEEKVELD